MIEFTDEGDYRGAWPVKPLTKRERLYNGRRGMDAADREGTRL